MRHLQVAMFECRSFTHASKSRKMSDILRHISSYQQSKDDSFIVDKWKENRVKKKYFGKVIRLLGNRKANKKATTIACSKCKQVIANDHRELFGHISYQQHVTYHCCYSLSNLVNTWIQTSKSICVCNIQLLSIAILTFAGKNIKRRLQIRTDDLFPIRLRYYFVFITIVR